MFVQQFDAQAVASATPWPALIDALRAAFVRGCELPLRHTHDIGSAGTSLLMPAWNIGGCYGVKVVNIFPGNGALGLPGLHGIYVLFSASTGAPLAWMDGSELTARRTAAAAALAASFLARPDARQLLVVGAGRVAALLPGALRAVRPDLCHVTVWNRNPAGAQALAQLLCAQGYSAQASSDLPTAVRSADIVSCATLSNAALIEGAWLQPGTHLDLIGSFTPQMREADGACFARSRVFVDTEEALAKSGDVLQAVAEGQFDPARLQGTLAQLCKAERAGRLGADEISVFKAVGTALEDLAAAELVAGVPSRGATDNPPQSRPPGQAPTQA